MLAKRRRAAESASATAPQRPGNWMRDGDTISANFGQERHESPETAAMSVYQLVGRSLEGPNGLHPETFMAALGALAGFSARWTVREAIEAGRMDNDFHKPSGINRPHVLVSENVNRLVCNMRGQSIVSVLTTHLMRSGADWLPDVNSAVQHNFEAINSPRYPDYTVAAKHFPVIPPQTLLMMLWEKTFRALRVLDDGPAMAPIAIAIAAAHAAIVHKGKVPIEVSGQLVLETAIAMSKLDYGM